MENVLLRLGCRVCGTIVLALCLLLGSGGDGVRAETFANWDMWQKGAFRGFDVSNVMSDKDWVAFDATGANLARMFVPLGPPVDNVYALPADAYAKVDKLVAQAKARNFKAVVTFNALPKAPAAGYWFNLQQQDSLVAILQEFARHYSGETAFAGFDIINEPYPITKGHPEAPANFDGPAAWTALSARIITAIRQEDPTRIIVYEWPYWGGNYKKLEPIAFDGVVYSSHWYTPLDFTYQGIEGRPTGYPYPTSESYGIGVWNREVLRSYLVKVEEFQQTYGFPVYFGEFSCARSIPGQSCFNYDTDVVSILEEFGFNWTYHIFRQAQVWDAERPAGYPSAPRNANTDLMTFLRTTMLSKNP